MEETERFELFGEHCIKDNNPDARCQLLDTYKACVLLNEQDKENRQLKQQLAEKTLTIEQINKAFIGNRSLWKGKYERANQDKISFAVEQLEKVKEKILSYENVYYQFLESGAKVPVVCLENFRVKQTIDNQIKQLKEGK